MDLIPEKFHYLLADETRAIAVLATTMPDHTPQLTPVWFTTDGKHILVNSTEGRVKDRNMRERPEVAILITDPDNPYRYIHIRGVLIHYEEDESLIHKLSEIYTGNPRFNIRPGDTRVTYTILPQKIFTYDW